MDSVKNPAHYQLEGLEGIESIDILRAVAGQEMFKVFCLCNVLKYTIRAEKKNGLEDYSLWSDEYIVTNNFPEILGMIEDTGMDLKEELNEYINKTYVPKIIDTYNKQNLINEEEVGEVEEVEETKED